MPAQPSPTIVAATVDELRRHAPFDGVDRPLLAEAATKMLLHYFAAGATILAPEHGVARRLWIVQRGQVRGVNVSAPQVSDALILAAGEMFPIGAVLSERATVLTFTAATDVFCYSLEHATFRQLMDQSSAFRQFATTRLAHLLDQSRRDMQNQYSQRLADTQTMGSPLSTIVRRQPLTAAADTPIADVLALMHRERVGSIVVIDGHDMADPNTKRPIGIFTERDVLGRVALPEADQSAPIASVMTQPPFCLPKHASVFEAAKAMAERRFRHVVVTDDDRLFGVVSERDLFQLQRLSLGAVAKAIERAVDGAALAIAAAEVRQLASSLIGQGVAAEQLTQFVTTMNDAVVGRALLLAAAVAPPPALPWCWLGLGSEGRMEQTLATDQDNAIIFTQASAIPTDEARAALLAFAAQVNTLLDQAGFPLCRGDIMAKNPKWCCTDIEWRATFSEWIRASSPQALLNAAIFFDFRGLHGDLSLADSLREWLRDVIAEQPLFLRHMAANALQVQPPLGVLRDFVDADAEFPGTIDLKKYGTRPFVDAARILALSHGVIATNTGERLRRVASIIRASAEEIGAYVDAFHFIQLLRLQIAETTPGGVGAQPAASQPQPNRIVIESLNDLDRRILKEALRQARKLQSRIALDFRL